MNNLTKIASLPQGGGCKAALVGEVQSRAVPEMSEATRGAFAAISDPANAHLFSIEEVHKAFFGVPSEAGPELHLPQITMNVTTMFGPGAQAEINRMIAWAGRQLNDKRL